MKLKTEDNQEIVIGAKKEMSFSIDDSNPVIFDILRNKMYTNKIGAICREVSSNARDANREAGLGDQPIEIEFTPTNNVYNIGDVCIIFRDFGKGIDPERMENIFMKYAASTKRSSDAQTGGFGLGAKTPFAYTDSFIIKTVCVVDGDKWEYTYNAIIDRSGKGKMIQMDEKMTTNKTGTEIIVPIVSSSDRNTFESECYRSTMYWKDVNYINFTSEKPEVEYIVETEEFSIVKSSGRVFTTPYIGLLDSIPYPIEPSKAYSGLGDGYHILFHLDVAHVTINANRESIQNDDETTEYLDEKVVVVETYLEDEINEYLTNHEDYKDALLKYSKIKESHSYRNEYTNLELLILVCKERYANNRFLSNFDFSVMYDDEKVNGRLGLKYHRVLRVVNTELDYERDSEKIIKCKFEYNNVETVGKTILGGRFIYMDKGRHSVAKQLHILEEDANTFFILIKRVTDDKITEEQFAEDITRLADIGMSYENYSEIVPPKKKIEYVKKDTSIVNLRVRPYSSLNWSQDLMFNKKTNAITKDKRHIKKRRIAFYPVSTLKDAYRFSWSNTDYMTDLLIAIGRLTDVYIINESTFNKHLAPKGYKRVDEIFNTLDKAYLTELKDNQEVKDVFDDEISEFLLENCLEVLPKSVSLLISKRDSIDDSTMRSLSSIRWNSLGVTGKSFDFEGFKTKLKNNLDWNYPMLKPFIRMEGVESMKIGSNKYKRAVNTIKNYLKTV